MVVTDLAFESACREHLDRFFAAHPDPALRERAFKALRLLRASDKPLKGKEEAWAAALIYMVATDGRIPCGVPGILNRDFEQLMGVPMATIRQRAAQVRALVTF